jgi:DNA-binding response OmpR family regulator
LKFPPAVLVVDEDIDARHQVAELLARAGYHVTTAANFQDAMHGLSTDPPDLLITEFRLGAFNGLHLVIRNRERDPASAALILTRFPDPVLVAYAAQQETPVIVKPVGDAELLRIVSQRVGSAVERRRTSRTRVHGLIEVRAAAHPARLVDLSDDGFQLEMAGSARLSTFALEVPVQQLLVQAKAIWMRRLGPRETYRWGATIAETDTSIRDAWREFVHHVRGETPNGYGDQGARSPASW